MSEETTRFQAAIAPFLDTWKTIDIRVIATKTDSGKWLAETFRARLDFFDSRATTRGLPRLPALVAIHKRWPASRLEEIFRALAAGHIELGDIRVLLQKGGRGGAVFAPLAPYLRRYERAEARAHFDINWSTWALESWDSWSDSYDSRHRQMLAESELRLANPPWEGLRDLRGNFVGLPPDEAARENIQRVEICAPLGLRLGAVTSPNGNDVQATVEREKSFSPKGSVLSVVAWRQGRVIDRFRTRLESVQFRLSTSRHVKHYVSEDIAGATVIVGRGANQTDRIHVSAQGSGPQAMRHSAFLAEGGSPEELLKALEREKGKPLEDAVAILFHLMGLNTIHYGSNLFGPRQGAADVLAFPPDGNWFLVVEATAHAADASADISKLTTRFRALQRAAMGLTVCPVWVTQQTMDALPAGARSTAAEERVSIITRDDFGELVALAFKAPTADDVLKAVVARIPPTAAHF